MKKFEIPEIKIDRMDIEDIITTSNGEVNPVNQIDLTEVY